MIRPILRFFALNESGSGFCTSVSVMPWQTPSSERIWVSTHLLENAARVPVQTKGPAMPKSPSRGDGVSHSVVPSAAHTAASGQVAP